METNNRFLQLHFITAYPPANLNRDDSGRPKTAMIGGAQRMRISSQSLKSAWRNSSVFKENLGSNLGIRTRRLGVNVYEKFINAGLDEKKACQWSEAIIGVFGKISNPQNGKKVSKKDKETNIDDAGTKQKEEEKKYVGPLLEQLVHFSQEEMQAIDNLVEICIREKKEPSKEQLDLLRKENSAADIACFGRMFANDPAYNFEAAVQVAHAFSVHEVAIEDDFFSAVDHLNHNKDDSGAAHIGYREYGAGIFYNYVCIDKELLIKNLNNDIQLAKRAIKALIETVATVSPTGMQNSFGSRAYTSYMLAENGDRQPRSLMTAFLYPIKTRPSGGDKNFLTEAIKELKNTRENIDKVYGNCAVAYYDFNTVTGEGSLEELVRFSVES